MIDKTIWIGYDPQFSDNLSVQLESIRQHSSDYSIKILNLAELGHILTRPRDTKQSTDSAFTRWLIPYLSNYTGWHLYMDSDMMVRKDLNQLWKLKDPTKSVMVVKHPNIDQVEVKFNNKQQSNYNRKNWSSLMLFNSERCSKLTPDYVNQATGLDLHQFVWTNDELIGDLPKEWNHLVGVDQPNSDVAIVHWTLGGPWFDDYKNVEYSKEWHSVNV